MTTSTGDIIDDGTDGRGEASAGSRTSFGRTNADPADAETASGSTSGTPPAASGAGGTANGESEGLSAADGSSTPPPASGDGDAGDLARVTAERDEYLDLARRTQAEFENFRKRAARERAELKSRATADVVRELLPVVDNIDRALEAAEAAGDGDPNALLDGIRLVHGEVHALLERLGLIPIETDGAKFDPNVHEAIASVAVDGVEPGVITDVHQRGFLLEETVVRPARVVVSA